MRGPKKAVKNTEKGALESWNRESKGETGLEKPEINGKPGKNTENRKSYTYMHRKREKTTPGKW